MLEPAQFPAYFAALWGHPPFPWQTRLLQQVVAGGRYPQMLELPTGSGKTSLVEIHLFALALEAGAPAAQHRQPRRLFFVVDRRVVVDQVQERAQLIAERLQRATSGILHAVSAALCSLSGSDTPLQATPLRGGMLRDESWAHTPDQPLVVSTTVDQIGSRLLFRGYGISPGMAPIHAGLVGEDALILLDEVHLARPFQQTLEAIAHHYRGNHPDLPRRWQVVMMSATVGDSTPRFALNEEDLSSPILRRRLHAPRPALLQTTRAERLERAGDRRRLVKDAATATLRLLAAGHRAIGVVVNRVAIARDLWALLENHRDIKRHNARVGLITGRMRPLDRARSQHLLQQLRADRGPEQDPETPIILVSTQCIEAGADIDFSALVTQAASLDALRQRFGRLNRMGRFTPSASDTAPGAPATGGSRPGASAVILLPPADSKAPPDPIYGAALQATAEFLRRHAQPGPTTNLDPGPDPAGNSAPLYFDFAPAAVARLLDSLPAAQRASLLAPATNAPLLLPTYLDLWVRTRPRPWPDPEVGPFLHGPRRDADVQVIWRDDLTEDLLQRLADAPSRATLRALVLRLHALPPNTQEAIALPLYAVRAWLGRVAATAVADVTFEVAPPSGSRGRALAAAPRPALRWAGDATELVTPDALRVGDTLLVPSSYGGLNPAAVWDPEAAVAVADRAEEAQWRARGRAAIRPQRCTVAEAPPDEWCRRLLATDAEFTEAEAVEPFADALEERRAIRDWLDRLVAVPATPDWLRQAAAHLRRAGWQRLLLPSPTGDAPTILLVGRRPRHATHDFDPAASSHTAGRAGAPLPLSLHARDTAHWARAFATRLGLPEPLIHDLALAAHLHDIGKADPRFQLLLANGDPVAAAMRAEPLAKSTLSPSDRAAHNQARQQAGFPAGYRHELLSLQLAEAAGDCDRAAFDPDLVRHLIASHHGWCRPLAPPVPDPDPVSVRHPFGTVSCSSAHPLAQVGSGIAARFARLNQRYGPHTLAWLEAIVRLADHRASQSPSTGDSA